MSATIDSVLCAPFSAPASSLSAFRVRDTSGVLVSSCVPWCSLFHALFSLFPCWSGPSGQPSSRDWCRSWSLHSLAALGPAAARMLISKSCDPIRRINIWQTHGVRGRATGVLGEDSPPLECKYNKCDFEFEAGIFGVAGCPCRTACLGFCLCLFPAPTFLRPCWPRRLLRATCFKFCVKIVLFANISLCWWVAATLRVASSALLPSPSVHRPLVLRSLY